MVTETVVETPVETPDQTPQEVQTEVEEETPGAAETPQEEAAVEEPKQVDEERRYTQTELDQMARQAAENAIEYDRRMRQSENARKAADAQREQKERAELKETVEVALVRAGLSDVDDAVVETLISKVGAKRGAFDVERAQGEMQQALAWVTAPLRGDPRPYEEYGLTPVADAFARAIQPHLQQILSAGQSAALEGYVPQADVDRLVAAARAAGRAESREGKTELKRPDGTPPTGGDPLTAWEARVAHQGEEGFPMLNDAEWRVYRQIRTEHGL